MRQDERKSRRAPPHPMTKFRKDFCAGCTEQNTRRPARRTAGVAFLRFPIGRAPAACSGAHAAMLTDSRQNRPAVNSRGLAGPGRRGGQNPPPAGAAAPGSRAGAPEIPDGCGSGSLPGALRCRRDGDAGPLALPAGPPCRGFRGHGERPVSFYRVFPRCGQRPGRGCGGLARGAEDYAFVGRV